MFLFLLVIVQDNVTKEHRWQIGVLKRREKVINFSFILVIPQFTDLLFTVINKTVRPIINLNKASVQFSGLNQKYYSLCLIVFYSTEMSNKYEMLEEEEYVDVRSLPLRPPQPAPPKEKPVRRAWHPIMWDESTAEAPTEQTDKIQKDQSSSREYPHTQRIRNLKRLIAEGKVKPTSETLIFFLCNKFAISEERQTKLSL